MGLFVSLAVGASVEQGPAPWSFPLALPETFHSPSSISKTVQVAGKGFLGNVCCKVDPTGDITTLVSVTGMSITDETGRTD